MVHCATTILNSIPQSENTAWLHGNYVVIMWWDGVISTQERTASLIELNKKSIANVMFVIDINLNSDISVLPVI